MSQNGTERSSELVAPVVWRSLSFVKAVSMLILLTGMERQLITATSIAQPYLDWRLRHEN